MKLWFAKIDVKAHSLTAIWALLSACGAQERYEISDDPASFDDRALSSANVGPIHSRRGWSGSVEIFVDKKAPRVVLTATESAIETWNEAVGWEVLVYKGKIDAPKQRSQFSTLDDSLTVIYYDEEWSSHMNKPITTLATTVWENGYDEEDKIVKADIILNAEGYFFQNVLQPSVLGDNGTNVADIETTILHELGHLLGLGHVSLIGDPTSVMHAQTKTGPSYFRRDLSFLDGELIRLIYDQNLE